MGMTDRDKKLLAIFAVVILLGGYWFLVLGKKRSAVAEAEQEKVAAQHSLDDAKNAVAAGNREKKRYPISYSRVVRLGKAIPDEADLASLIVQVNDISVDTGVRFQSLVISDGAAGAAGATGASGVATTCGEGGATGATAAAATPAPTGATGPTQANTGVGQAINDANDAARDSSDQSSRSAAAEQEQAEKCAAAPTLTDLAAASAGLQLTSFKFKFKGSFFDLHKVIHRLMGMVEAREGKVKVAGRLLQINSVNMTSGSFPDLEAEVDMTGYVLPESTSLTAGGTPSGPAGSPTSNPTPAPAPPAS